MEKQKTLIQRATCWIHILGRKGNKVQAIALPTKLSPYKRKILQKIMKHPELIERYVIGLPFKIYVEDYDKQLEYVKRHTNLIGEK